MTTVNGKKITIALDAETSERLESAASLEGVSVGEYCREAIEVHLDENGTRRTIGKPLTHETLDKMDAIRKEIFGDKKFPGNSADAIREMREERALQIERAVKGC